MRPKPRSAMALAEPRFDLGNLGELLRRQFALQSFDRLGKVFSVPAALDGVVGKTLGAREGLALAVIVGRRLAPRRSHCRYQRVGEIAPGIELIGADADLCLSRIQLHGETTRTETLPRRALA